MNFENQFQEIKKNIKNICDSYNSKIRKLEKEKEEWNRKDEYMTNFLHNNNFMNPNELLVFIKKYKGHICHCDCIPISIYNKYIDIYKIDDITSFFDNSLSPVKIGPAKNIKLEFDFNILKKIQDENKKYKEELKNKDKIIKTNNIINKLEKEYMRLDNNSYIKYIDHLNYSWNSIRDDYDKIVTEYSKKTELALKKRDNKNLSPEEYIQKKCPIKVIDKNNIDEKTNLLLDYNIEKFRNEYNLLNNSVNCSVYEIVNKSMELNISKQAKHRIKNKLTRFSEIYKHIGNNLKYFKFNYSNLIDMKEDHYKIWIKYFKNFVDNYFIE